MALASPEQTPPLNLLRFLRTAMETFLSAVALGWDLELPVLHNSPFASSFHTCQNGPGNIRNPILNGGQICEKEP